MKFAFLFQIFVLDCIHFGYASKRVTETWKDTNEGIKFKIKRSLFTKIPNVEFKVNHSVNIIQQTQHPTPTHCGKACQDLIPCSSFLFYRKKRSSNCLLVDHSVNKNDIKDDVNADYYEIQVILYLIMANILSTQTVFEL